MSFLYRTGDNAGSARFAIGLGDSNLSGNGNLRDEDANPAAAEQAIGFALPYNAAHGGIPMNWDTNTYDGGNINADPTFTTTTAHGLTSGSNNNFGFYPDNNTTYLFVLHAQWGAGSGSGSALDTWATSGTVTGVTFEDGANGDGVQDGMAFLPGANTPDEDATGLLPTASEWGSTLIFPA